MKVLYLSNAIPTCIIQHAKIQIQEVGGGWVESLLHLLLETGEIQPIIGFPLSEHLQSTEGTMDGLSYFSFPKKGDGTHYSVDLIAFFTQKIKKYQPDIIHIFGTEYPHSLCMIKACNNINQYKILVSIQGLLKQYADAYLLGIPESWKRKGLPQSNRMRYYQYQMSQRAVYEKQVLEQVYFVTGRTQWDMACTKQANPNIQYLFCNEILRPDFYDDIQWKANQCIKHRVFFSQASYPIKGVHVLLRNLSVLVNKYPDLTIHIGGNTPMNTNLPKTCKQKIQYAIENFLLKTRLVRNYPAYVEQLIKDYNLRDKVSFCGPLTAQQMKQEYLQANVFVSSSLIENSPNSMGEAMMLGMPIVASHVGGVADMLQHNKEGYLFPLSEEYMLPYYINRFFENDELCMEFGMNARKKAQKIYDRNSNKRMMLNNYQTVCRFTK